MSSSANSETDSSSAKRESPQPEESKGSGVQLPSIFTTFEDPHRRASLPTLHSESRRISPYVGRQYAPSSLATYTFPPDTPYTPYSDEGWSPGIVRPSSTPGDRGPMSQAQMFAGSARISGHHDRRGGIKSEWSFPNPDFVLPTNFEMPSESSPPTSTLVDRPQRKRGKLPKETTDFLKAWLHRHSDHPYPSEEEKKQLCHATGLSMSQVSNWMINVIVLLFHSMDLIELTIFIKRLVVVF